MPDIFANFVNICQNMTIASLASINLVNKGNAHTFENCQCSIEGQFQLTLADVRLQSANGDHCSPAKLQAHFKTYQCEGMRSVFNRTISDTLTNEMILFTANSTTEDPEMVYLTVKPQGTWQLTITLAVSTKINKHINAVQSPMPTLSWPCFGSYTLMWSRSNWKTRTKHLLISSKHCLFSSCIHQSNNNFAYIHKNRIQWHHKNIWLFPNLIFKILCKLPKFFSLKYLILFSQTYTPHAVFPFYSSFTCCWSSTFILSGNSSCNYILLLVVYFLKFDRDHFLKSR